MSEFDAAMRPHECWLNLFAELRFGKSVSEHGAAPEEPAAPHLPVTSDGYDPDGFPSTLLTGQAPRSPMRLTARIQANNTAETCYKVTCQVLSRAVTGDVAYSPFWCFENAR